MSDLKEFERWLDAWMKQDPEKVKAALPAALKAAGLTRVNGTCATCGQMTGVCLAKGESFESRNKCFCGGKLEKCS